MAIRNLRPGAQREDGGQMGRWWWYLLASRGATGGLGQSEGPAGRGIGGAFGLG